MSIWDRKSDKTVFEVYEFIPGSHEDYLFMRTATLLSGYMIESSKLKILAFGFLRVLDYMVPLKLSSNFAKSTENLMDRTIKAAKVIYGDDASHSLWLDVNVMSLSLNHLLKLLEQLIYDFKDDSDVFLVIEYTYNILRSIIDGMQFFICGFDIEKIKQVHSEDEKKINEFKEAIINNVWKLDNFDTKEKRLSLLVVMLGFITNLVDVMTVSLNISIEEELRKRGGIPMGEAPGD